MEVTNKKSTRICTKNCGGCHEPDNWIYLGVCTTLVSGKGRIRERSTEQQSLETESEGHVEECYLSMDAAIGEEDIYFSG